MAGPGHTNRLIHETSPYLLQHAHNPVDWHPWNEKTLEKARKLDRMLLVSIGYSSCHWCHVMEKESFTDEDVAAFMNRHFICIKVDREERPDVDQIYMNAVQLISGGGGWPLNCFALSDGRPFFGGTYFKRDQWMQLLENIARLFSNRRDELEAQASSLTEGVRQSDFIPLPGEKTSFGMKEAEEYYSSLRTRFDPKEGGMAGTPKFPMPVYYHFLLRYYYHTRLEEVKEFIRLSLRKMAYGGIYDQLGGGFSRYSTDSQWKIPHFEKMLYDNAQLIKVYSEAYQLFGDPLFKEVVTETMTFVKRELTSPDGGFYSALDADSEGKEGWYYTWEAAEVKNIVGNHGEWIRKYYHIGGKGLWEGDRSILLRTFSPEEFATEQGIRAPSFKSALKAAKGKLLKARLKRVRPGLDNKILTSWNAMMLKACLAAYKAFGRQEYLKMALNNAEFIRQYMTGNGHELYHSYGKGKAAIRAFLEDHGLLADALLELYQLTLEVSWLDWALEITESAISHFSDKGSGMFFFTQENEKHLIARKIEVYDNVVPSSNSVMAHVLLSLGQLLDRRDLVDRATRMLENIVQQMMKYPGAFAFWASLILRTLKPSYVIAFAGKEAGEKARKFHSVFMPNVLLTGSGTPVNLPYLHNRFVEDRTLIYVCSGKECLLPTEDPEAALEKIKT